MQQKGPFPTETLMILKGFLIIGEKLNRAQEDLHCAYLTGIRLC